MAFISSTSFIPRHSSILSSTSSLTFNKNVIVPSTRSNTAARPMIQMNRSPQSPLGGNGKKQSRNRRYRSNKAAKSTSLAEKTKLEPETVFMDQPPSRLELIVPTISILTVVGIFPFIGAVARALWVRYKITSRRISVTSGFQGKDQTEIIYRDIAQIKYVKRLGDAADCVISLKDGAKIEIRSIPNFDETFKYMMERVDEDVRNESGPA